MAVQLKPVRDQIIVITGASSGIGLTTARMAAQRGAKLVLAARNEQALTQLQDTIRGEGGEAVVVVADVGHEDDVRRISDAAHQAFGGFDTWLNNAGITVYGKIEEVSLEDHRRLFDTNFWGVVHGSRIALETLRSRGGALINIGSVLSERAIPLQGMYSASKHAVSGVTEALRMEVEKDDAPVSITLILPSAIDTPYTEHARTYMEEEPSVPPPVYTPDLVAQAILHCAEHPERTVTVGGGGKLIDMLGNHAPGLMDKVMQWTMYSQQKKDRKTDPLRHDALYRPYEGGKERGQYEGRVRHTSLYTQAELHPVATTLTIAGLAIGGLALLGALTPSGRRAGRRLADRASAARLPEYLAYQERFPANGQPPVYEPRQEPLHR